MRTSPALLVVAMVLIMTTLQADADAILKPEEKDPKRQLLGETDLGRKAIAGGGSDSIHITNDDFDNSKIVNSNNGVAKVSYNKNDDSKDDNEVNDSYQNYENGPGTSTSSHHIFIQKPPIHG